MSPHASPSSTRPVGGTPGERVPSAAAGGTRTLNTVGPHAVLLCGPAASGKSVVGRELARLLGWPLLDLDTVTAALYELSGGEEAALLPSSSGRSALNTARYASLFDTARENLDLGVSLVLVAPFTLEQASAPAWAAACAALGVAEDHVQLVWVDTPAEVAAERMRRRAATRDEGRIASLDAAPQSPVPVAAPVVPHLVSDGLVPPSLQARRIAAALSAPHPA